MSLVPEIGPGNVSIYVSEVLLMLLAHQTWYLYQLKIVREWEADGGKRVEDMGSQDGVFYA
jgi:hypothetical protein